MSVDIERTVIYDVTIDEIPGTHDWQPKRPGRESWCENCHHTRFAAEYFSWPCVPFMPKTRTVLTASDDGFLQIEETRTAEDGVDHTTSLHLTPTMIDALLQWRVKANIEAGRRAGAKLMGGTLGG
jgi:hypothetical protein